MAEHVRVLLQIFIAEEMHSNTINYYTPEITHPSSSHDFWALGISILAVQLVAKNTRVFFFF